MQLSVLTLFVFLSFQIPFPSVIPIKNDYNNVEIVPPFVRFTSLWNRYPTGSHTTETTKQIIQAYGEIVDISC